MQTASLIAALSSAVLFGAATPVSKALLTVFSPFQLAGLLYLGAAAGVLPFVRRGEAFPWPWHMTRKTFLQLVGAVVCGGLFGPVFLLLGLEQASASSVSLWLNLELLATMILGQLWFRDHLTLSGWLSGAAMLAGALLITIADKQAGIRAGMLVGAACILWGLDNHLTALIRGITPAQTTFYKGIAAGTVNFAIGYASGPFRASPIPVVAAVATGIFSYGASIVLYVASAQRLGAARSQILFSMAPFFGLLLSVALLGEPLTKSMGIAAGLMLASVVFLSVERHAHVHHHRAKDHEHWHRHDDGHHEHESTAGDPGQSHTHRHEHEEIAHSHPHWPDPDHRHQHRKRQS